MVDCGAARCLQEKRILKKELLTWSKKVPLLIDDDVLLGIGLCSEATIRKPEHDITLGSVMITKQTMLTDLRQTIASRLPGSPSNFCFVSEQGWPVQQTEENNIEIQTIITGNNSVRLQRLFDKPRVGIKIANNMSIGFVFIQHHSPLSTLREAIYTQLGHITSEECVDYLFLDRNGWTISKGQEQHFTVIEVTINSCVSLVPSFKKNNLLHSQSDSFQEDSICTSSPSISNPSIKQLTFTTSKDQERRISLADTSQDGVNSKQVLISYVRAEAAAHALVLKQELVDLGHTVYLDVHEIKSGIDWQDSLNNAVRNCEIFVPLVTVRYGETQWTNREVKLADVLGKIIIPVSFLDHWPPRCLAIQFATTQYVAWKTMDSLKEEESEGDGERVWDTRFWDQHHVRKVAGCIAEQIKLNLELESSAEAPVDFVQGRTRLHSLKRKISSNTNILLNGCPLSQISRSGDGGGSIVLCVHPDQHKFGMELKEMLESESYSVWCSSEMYETASNDPFTNSETFSGSESFPEEDSKSHSLNVSRRFGLHRIRSIDSFNGDLCLSQGMSSQVSAELDPSEKEMQREFQEKADKSCVIIFVLSKAFALSKISKQQVFYCEHRKQVIPMRYEEFCMPYWMSMLIGTGVFEDVKYDSYKDSLKNRLKQLLNPEGIVPENLEVNECHITQQARRLRHYLPSNLCIYISGGTKFYHKNTADICKAIGESLAMVDGIHLVTGGFYGVGETLARSFLSKRREHSKVENVWHILPKKDSMERGHQARQKDDKTFAVMPYGKTVFSGNSVREREIIVARVMDVCILLEGGPGAAHEAEQFIWNDHTVIPITCTGGAAGGKFDVPKKIFEIPQSVMEDDWKVLQNQHSSCYEIADSVSSVIQSLQEKLKLDLGTSSKRDNSIEGRKRQEGRKRSKVTNHGTNSKLSRQNTIVYNSESDQDCDSF